jgi:hypothetical protein
MGTKWLRSRYLFPITLRLWETNCFIGGNMKYLAALGLLLFAPVAPAGPIIVTPGPAAPTNYQGVINDYLLPAGFQITSDTLIIGQQGNESIAFTFPGGAGTVFGGFDDGDSIDYTFNVPMLSATWDVNTGISEFNIGSTEYSCPTSPVTPPGCSASGTVFLANLSSFSVLCYGGYCGLDSVTPAIEPGTFLLLASGLAWLWFWRKREVRFIRS